MIRRATITLAFAVLGLASLMGIAVIVYPWVCAHLPGLCKVYEGPCPGIDICVESTFAAVKISFFYFGSPVGLGLTGFVLSRQRRSPAAWLLRAGAAFAICCVLLLVMLTQL